jgi:hypothetical protein
MRPIARDAMAFEDDGGFYTYAKNISLLHRQSRL